VDTTEKQSEIVRLVKKCENFKSEIMKKFKILNLYEEETKGYEKLKAANIVREM
jgi:hypothetical protein